MRKFRLAALAGGIGLLAWLVIRAGPARLATDLLRVGWWMAALLCIGAVRNAFRTEAVKLALCDAPETDERQFGFAELYAVLMVSEAIKFATFAGLFVGEAAKGWLLKRRVSGARAASTVMIDVLLYYLTAMLFSLAALVIFFSLYPATDELRKVGMAGAAVLAAAVVLGAIAFRKRWLGARRLLSPLAWVGLIRRRESLERFDEIDEQLFSYHQRHPGGFRLILACDFAAHLLAALEVTAILWLLGLGGGFTTGVVVEGLTKLVEVGGLVVPGDIGLYQGGTGLIFRGIGFRVTDGVSVGIIRQIRSILWAGIGFLVLLLPGMGGKARKEPRPFPN